MEVHLKEIVRGHSTSPLGTNRKHVCDFLLANYTSLHPISHRFQDSTEYLSNFRCRQGGASR